MPLTHLVFRSGILDMTDLKNNTPRTWCPPSWRRPKSVLGRTAATGAGMVIVALPTIILYRCYKIERVQKHVDAFAKHPISSVIMTGGGFWATHRCWKDFKAARQENPVNLCTFANNRGTRIVAPIMGIACLMTGSYGLVSTIQHVRNATRSSPPPTSDV